MIGALIPVLVPSRLEIPSRLGFFFVSGAAVFALLSYLAGAKAVAAGKPVPSRDLDGRARRAVTRSIDRLRSKRLDGRRPAPAPKPRSKAAESASADESDLLGQLQQVLGEPGALLGAIQSDAQRALKPQLEATVAVVAGVVDHVMDQVGAKLIGSYGMLTEALRRRRVETSEADRFVERMLGLELTQATYDRGTAFVDGVVERAGEEGLARLWESKRNLPSPPEVDAPGLWLARIDLPTDDD